MTNETNSSVEYTQIFLRCERINAFLILIENIFVAVCLLTHRTNFRKKEFWLQLISLTNHDLFTGILILILSYLRSTLNYNFCTVLWLFITINEMTFLCNILGICIYRLLFLIKPKRFRFNWTTKATLLQFFLSFIICTLYASVPLILGWTEQREIEECSIPQLFGTNLQKYGLYMGFGFGLLLVCTDVLYSILLYKLQKILKKRQNMLDRMGFKHIRSTAIRPYTYRPGTIRPSAIRLRTYKDISASNRRNVRTTFLVSSKEGRDNQKQCVYLIGAILLWINLSVGAPIVVHFIAINTTSVQLSKVLFQLMILIPMNNSFFNPWIYALQSREFRRAVKENMANFMSLFRKK